MTGFPEAAQAFRDRFGYTPEIPFPWLHEVWADVLRECVEADSDRPYRDAIEHERKLVGDGIQ